MSTTAPRPSRMEQLLLELVHEVRALRQETIAGRRHTTDLMRTLQKEMDARFKVVDARLDEIEGQHERERERSAPTKPVCVR